MLQRNLSSGVGCWAAGVAAQRMTAFAAPVTIAVFSLATPAEPQAAAAADCNHLTRTLQQPAGITGSVSTNCAQVTVSVAGQSFSTPASCVVAYSHYLASVYSCGPAATGIHCNPQGYKATIKNYSDGACPSVSGLTSGMTWSGWDEVPANLVAIIQGLGSCVAPKMDSTFDWSASVVACPKKAQPPNGQTGEPLPPRSQATPGLPSDGSGLAVWQGDPRLLIHGEFFNPFGSAYDAAMQPRCTSSALLGEVESHFAPLAGAEIDVSLELRHYAAGASEPAHVWSAGYEGRISSEGTFDLVQTSIARQGEAGYLATLRQYYDGHLLAFSPGEGPVSNAYSPSYAGGKWIWATELLPQLRPLYWWLGNPFRIPRFESHRYTTDVREGVTYLEKRASERHGGYVDLAYAVDTDNAGVPAIVSSQVLEPSGSPRETVVFGDFRAVADRVYRPFAITYTIFPDGFEQGRRVECRYRFNRARLLEAQQVTAIREAELESLWHVWR